MSERHDRVVGLLTEHAPPAPASLRARVEAERRRAAEPRAASSFSARIALAGAAAAAALAVAFVAPSLFDSEDVGALDVHALGSRGEASAAPAPEPEPGAGELLSASVDGVTFPDWTREFGWRPVGYREDSLSDRETETVYYHHEGHTIAYTIVSGEPLEIPDEAVTRNIGGVGVASLRDGHGHDIVVFERGGHTCVLSGHVEHSSTLLELASWRGDGRVTF